MPMSYTLTTNDIPTWEFNSQVQVENKGDKKDPSPGLFYKDG